jgi:hypothetical protein
MISSSCAEAGSGFAAAAAAALLDWFVDPLPTQITLSSRVGKEMMELKRGGEVLGLDNSAEVDEPDWTLVRHTVG